MRAITMSVPSLTVRMEVNGAEHEVQGLKTKTPYVKVDGVKYLLSEDEREYALEMTRVFSDFWREPKCETRS